MSNVIEKSQLELLCESSFFEFISKQSFDPSFFVVATLDGTDYVLTRVDDVTVTVNVVVESKQELVLAYLLHNQVKALSDLDKLLALVALLPCAPSFSDLEQYLSFLGLSVHREFTVKIMKLFSCDSCLLNTLSDKKFSLKQALLCLRYDRKLLAFVCALSDRFSLSSSLFLEVLDMLFQLMGRHKLGGVDEVSRFVCWDEIESVTQLRQQLFSFCYPTLSEKNALIQEKIYAINLPTRIRVFWDKTLENKALRVEILCQKTGDCGELAKQLLHRVSEINSVLEML